MHLCMRADRALGPGRRRIIDNAVSINGVVDYAVPRLEKELRLWARHGLVGNHVADCPAAIGRRVIVTRFPPGLDEVSRTVSHPVVNVEILDRSRRHRPARRKRHRGDRNDQETTNFHD
jgi:hypothetical protein